ncbi:unnamed protein product [Ostreobium quekettii]|uniref:GB1/RHD3-type G domain-containing protein n=1 Tax=Ostreobium quekettii TaxID=121088 RepID=A0A8S1JAT5_9CHLO|nr:unnamed protein product [Ostreobium quekettii]|eukprot:evm.model.scf_854.7 EVM.evm.TU.scf_854.7   scf_854:38174-44776(-)
MGTESPLELVRFEAQSNKFVVGRPALDALRAVRGPVGVVAVCGRARQGKSYILNQLLGRTSGFKVSPTQRPCTKGIWMWSKPIQRRAPDGSVYHLILLDSEGIDAYDQTGHYSTQIFSLAVLLSSLFVYNHMGGIDEAALDKLSLVTEMTNLIRVRSQASSDRDIGGFTPAFLWLLRDFYLDLEEDGRKISPKDYLEQALLPATGSGPAVEMKNKIRRSIKTLFPQRDCCALVRPVSDEQQLKNLENVPQSQLRPEFTRELRRLMDVIFSRAVPKRVGQQVITGPALAGLTEAYVRAINNGAVPTIVTAWQAVADGECHRARDLAEAHYRKAFNSNVPPEEIEMAAEHERALAEARKVFNEHAVGDEDIRSAHEARFEENVKSWFSNFRDKKIAEAKAAIDRMLCEASTHFQKLAGSGHMDASKFRSQVKAFMQDYASRTSGTTKWRRMADFVLDCYASFATDLEQRLKAQLTEKNRAEERAADRLSKMEQSAKVAQEKLEELKQQGSQYCSERDQMKLNAEELQRQLSDLRAKSASVSSAQEQAQQEARNLREQVSRKDHELQALHADLGTVKQESSTLKLRAQELTLQLDGMRTKMDSREQTTAEMRRKLDCVERELSVAKDDLRKRESDMLSQASQQASEVSSAMREVAQLTGERDQAVERATSLEQELQTMRLTKEMSEHERQAAAGQLAQASQELENRREETMRLQRQAVMLDESLSQERSLRESAQDEVLHLKELVRKLEAEASTGAVPEEALASPQLGKRRRHPTVSANGEDAHGLPVADELASPHTSQAAEDGDENLTPGTMTVKKIKEWLLKRGHGGDIWDLEKQRPGPKKADWLQLMDKVRKGSGST